MRHSDDAYPLPRHRHQQLVDGERGSSRAGVDHWCGLVRQDRLCRLEPRIVEGRATIDEGATAHAAPASGVIARCRSSETSFSFISSANAGLILAI